MIRLLRACILANPSTSDKGLVVVDGGQLELESYYGKDDKTWRSDKKLFNFEAVHKWVFCDRDGDQKHTIPEEHDDYIFLCNGPVAEVYASLIENLSHIDLNLPTTFAASKHKRWLKGRFSDLLPSVPRGIRVSQTGKARELKVSWESAESIAVSKLSGRMLRVVLHRAASCRSRASDLLFDEGMLFCFCLAKWQY
jgi:hypothetical protein